eukprot:g11834.t1
MLVIFVQNANRTTLIVPPAELPICLQTFNRLWPNCFTLLAIGYFATVMSDQHHRMSDNELEEERGNDPEREEPENEQTEEKKSPDQAVAGITDGVNNFYLEQPDGIGLGLMLM